MIVLVFGLPGSGKSYFASRLAEKLRADYENSDQLRRQLFPVRTYSKIEKEKVYEILLKRVEEAVIGEKDLVLDATFHKSERRELFSKKAKGDLVFIEVWADEDIIRKRLKIERPYSEADFEVYQLIKKEWEPLEEDHLVLQSTSDNIEIMLENALQYLKDDRRTAL